MSDDRRFPYGQVKGPVPVLVILRSDVLVEKYAPYFPAPGAMFIGYQAPIAGRAFAAVVTIGCRNLPDAERFERWMNEVVRSRMVVGAPEILHL